MDWSSCAEVERIPGKVSGAWLLKGTRVPAEAVIENAMAGFTAEQIATEIFDGVSVERVRQVIAFARRNVPHPA